MIRYTALLGLVLSHFAYAADTNSDCGHFHLQISNLTKSTCVLNSHHVVHGNLISAPPASIMPNDSKSFDMEQTIYGPAIALSYQCGDDEITLASKQNVCVMDSGHISGEILPPLPRSLNATYTTLSGSYLWDKPGMINWKIVNK